MITNKQFFPDELPTSAPKKTTPTEATPRADMDFLTLAETASKKWLVSPEITLVWLKASDFATQVADYRTALTSTRQTGSQRPAQTQNLNVLDKKVNAAVTEVKVYIRKKFKDNAEANYTRYGIVKESNTYRLPKDRDERKEALSLMKAAIAADGFGSEEYGTTFWTAMVTDYKTAYETTNTTDGAKSGSVASKNVLKKNIRKALKSLRLVIEGNYPDTYKEMVRVWGWQKENY